MELFVPKPCQKHGHVADYADYISWYYRGYKGDTRSLDSEP